MKKLLVIIRVLIITAPLPLLSDLEKNISLMLINSHRSMDIPRPSMPGLIDVGGIHIKKSKTLPHALQQYLDNSPQGVIYFSMGSYVQSTDLPAEKLAIFLNAFAKLNQNILWKYENASIQNLPPNIRIEKWMPQNDILAHSNVQLFISHGGIFGTQESLHWGVPLLCIPLYGDQRRNSAKAVQQGYARAVKFSELTSQILLKNIEILLEDKSYKQKAVEISKKFRDNPLDPMEEALYWIDYVIRHKGAEHLKSKAVYMPLYRYFLLDVFVVYFIVILAVLWILKIIRNLVYSKFRYFVNKNKKNV